MYKVRFNREKNVLYLFREKTYIGTFHRGNLVKLKGIVKRYSDVENIEELVEFLKTNIYLKINGNFLYLYYPYSEEFIKAVKRKGALWDKEKKCWKLPKELLDEELYEYLKKKFKWNEEDKEILEEVFQKNKELRELSERKEEDFEVPLPNGKKLYPYQKAGVRFLLEKNGVALLGDEMGLGKTVQVIGFFNSKRKEEAFPALIICPSSVKKKWIRELKEWCIHDVKVTELNGTTPTPLINGDVYVINYDILPYWTYVLKEKGIKTVVVDEGHYIKNPSAQRTKAVFEFQSVPHKIVLTGTPIVNNLEELFTSLKFLRPDIFRNKNYFLFRYGDKPEELQEFLRKTVMIRRVKKDVLKELPSKVRVLEEIEVDLRPLKEIEEEIAEKIRGYTRFSLDAFSEILPLFDKHREIAGILKIPYLAQKVEELLKNGEKVVIFAHHKSVISKLSEKLPISPLIITGETSQKERQKIVDYFNEKGKVLIASIGALAEGVNLTGASYVFFLQIDWTPAKNLQAEDRLHRIGQKNTVFSYWLIAKDSIDQHVVGKVAQKIELIEKALGSSESSKEFSDFGKDWSEIFTEIAQELFG